ncbi:MAG TPA: alkaline phosphatase PhoX [Planctomycetota bacterium]|nr:alkaline phosphatase PhoX [Planctomycetota bacterium]
MDVNSKTATRRSFLKGGALLAGGLAAAGPLQALLARSAEGAVTHIPFSPDYGPLSEVNDLETGLPLIMLPKGFTYRSLGWAGDALANGTPTPGLHDGMGVVQQEGDDWAVLVRNHEVRSVGNSINSFAPAAITYDPKGGGGTTNLLVNLKTGRLKKAWASIGGTNTNCAGGVTPWRSWITCEETLVDTANAPLEKTHGWCYDVPAFDDAEPEPLLDMGRFVHEAVSVDPKTEIVYLSEDRGTAGLYRYSDDNLECRRRNRKGKKRKNSPLSGEGVLEMLKVKGVHQADLRGTSTAIAIGAEYDVEWVEIEDPHRAHFTGTDSLGCFKQGLALGGATFTRLEGTWFGNKKLYFTSTDGGTVREGQVWEYDPQKERLTLIFSSPAEATLDNPDNITVTPRGGLILCEDGSLDGQRLQGLTLDGQIFEFARNNVVLNGERNSLTGDFRGIEWAGATFDWKGEWLFANIQTPGITFAITGPWHKGSL